MEYFFSRFSMISVGFPSRSSFHFQIFFPLPNYFFNRQSRHVRVCWVSFFSLSHIFITISDSQVTLRLFFGFTDVHLAAVSKLTVIKLSYSLFGVHLYIYIYIYIHKVYVEKLITTIQVEGEIYWEVDTIAFRFYWTIIRTMRGDISDFKSTMDV